FSSRRRHTRSYGDWSSDVCSSDLVERGDLAEELTLALQREELEVAPEVVEHVGRVLAQEHLPAPTLPAQVVHVVDVPDQVGLLRSEERRVGKECRSLCEQEH